jgi:hypothetical protein
MNSTTPSGSSDAGADGDNRQQNPVRGHGRAAAGAQLAAAAGLTPEVARSLSLEQVVVMKFDRDESPSDRQSAGY